MLYRENGQFKCDYASDQQILPIAQDRWFLVRGHVGRGWMATRDMDVAAEVIGIRPLYAKLTAFAVSSFYAGVAGALWGFVHLGAWEPLAFNINLSLNLLFMIIIGGMGSLLGAYFGAAFIVLLPILLDLIPTTFGVH